MMLPCTPRLKCQLALALAGVLAACGPGPVDTATVGWDPLHGDGFEVVAGKVELTRDAWVSRWYGQESPAAAETVLLGDERAVLRVQTPSHLAVVLGAGEPRQFQSGLRRGVGGPEGALRAELFWESTEGGEPRSLFAIELEEDAQWHELTADVPAEAGTLRLLVRYTHPALAEIPGPTVSWGAPRVSPKTPTPESAGLPDIILVTVDTLRADYVPAAMPWVSQTVARGSYWPQAISPSNWTLPAYASLLTGLDAGEHGAGRSDFNAEPGGGRDYTELQSNLRTFVGTLSDAGYATCMVHQNPFLEPWTGLSRDFERWVRVADAPLAGREVADAWWAQNADRPRLLVLHFFAPHLPYSAESVEGLFDASAAPDPFEGLEVEAFLAGDHSTEERADFFALSPELQDAVRQRYQGEVRVLDRRLEEWLGPRLSQAWTVGAGDSAISEPRSLMFAFHADHGEELWDDASFEHGHSFHDSVTRVPLALVWPGRILPAVDTRPVSARLLGLEILRVIGLEDDALPAADLAERLPPTARSTHPLYRSKTGGRVFSLDGSAELLRFDGQGSGGDAPVLPESVARQLAELGYASEGG